MAINSIDELIKKVDRITASGSISMVEHRVLIDFMISIDPENSIILEQLKQNRVDILDNTISILEQYNVIESDHSTILTNKQKVFLENGKLKKVKFNIYKFNPSTEIINIIEKVKQCLPNY
jgi:hypothetical protein